MSSIKDHRWDCTECGVNQGRNDRWYEGDVCGECHDEKELAEKKKAVNAMLLQMYSGMGIDVPSNQDDILEFVFEDVDFNADPDNWHSGDVAIGFRRWIEEQQNKSYPACG